MASALTFEKDRMEWIMNEADRCDLRQETLLFFYNRACHMHTLATWAFNHKESIHKYYCDQADLYNRKFQKELTNEKVRDTIGFQ